MTKRYLPLTFLSTLALGALCPQPGVMMADWQMTKYCTVGVFVCSGLLLERKEAAKALVAKGSIVYGLTSILLLTPIVAPALMALPLQPKELVLGLTVFALSPTTLSTGVNLIQAAGGNVAMALMLTLVSNFLSVFTIPVALSWLFGRSEGGIIALSPYVLLINLIVTVLVPTLMAYALKSAIPEGERWVRARRKSISSLGTLFLIMIPWMQVSKASAAGITIDPLSLSIAVSIGIALHLAYFGGNQLLANFLKLGGPGRQGLGLRRAVVLMSSQKSVTIAVAVLSQLVTVLGPEAIGIAIIPCVLVHLAQTVIDSFIASHWSKTQQSNI